ncbi:MAG TPA: pyridoxal-dependent decarboxylase, exosortase A system-associated [Steroidobacteraceae bacterium]|nr:pyridoxal-dependent decarboxylase, exosortase A system-associated [Steroidobacteraceae bacterium]
MTIAGLDPHAVHPYFEVHEDCLTICGRPVTEVAREAGRTPFYVYGRQYMTARVAELRARLPRSVHLHYAIKANPMPAVVQHMAGLVDGLDVASGSELNLALRTGTEPTRISFAGPGKTDAELAQAAAAGIVINVESEREISVLADIGRRGGRRPRVAVRVNPDFELKTSGMKMGGGPKQFGIDAEVVPQLLKGMSSLPLEFTGFHIFSGSQNLRAEAIVDAQRKSVALAVRLAAAAPGPVRTLNIGGGFGIPYFPGERPLELEPIGANLRELVNGLHETLPEAQLVIELGRYLVGEAGLYVCRVIDRKISRGQVFLVTDGGLHHHLAASGNFGQVLRKNYPVVIANRVRGAAREVASVVGPLCTPLDLLADRAALAVAGPGDLVAVLQSGAYGLTASPTAFLSHPPPAELLI